MHLSPHQVRLAAMLKRCVEAPTAEARLAKGAEVFRDYPPDDYSDDYADLLALKDTPFRSKELIIRILFIIADDWAIRGLTSFVCDQAQPSYLRTSAVMLLIRLDLEIAKGAVTAGAPWLMPLIDDEEENPSGVREPVLVTIDDLEAAGEEVVIADVPSEDRARRFKQAFENVLTVGGA